VSVRLVATAEVDELVAELRAMVEHGTPPPGSGRATFVID